MRAERRHPARPKCRVPIQRTDLLQEDCLASKPNRIPKQLGRTVSRERDQGRVRWGAEVWGDARRSPRALWTTFVRRARATIEDRKQNRPCAQGEENLAQRWRGQPP